MGANMRSATVRLAVLLAAGLTTWTPAGMPAAEPAASQVWLVNTRRAPCFCSSATDAAPLEYWRLGPDNQWTAANQQGFLASDDPSVPTSFFIHGNRSDEVDAVNEGCGFYHTLRSLAPDRPLRFVIWSWPADRIAGRNRYDVQVKASRSDGQSCHLAQLLRRMDPRVSVSLTGYSFGARIITGACHMLAGGEVAGQTIAKPNATPRPAPVRAVLVASAEDFDWLAPGACHGLALNTLDRVLITVNCADPVLKHYPALYGRRGPQALGHVGPACGADQANIELLNVACSVGNTHQWDCYSADPTLHARLPWYAFLQPSTAGTTEHRQAVVQE